MGKKAQPKVKSYVLFGGHTEDFNPETTSQIVLREGSKEGREKPECIGIFATKPGSQNIRTLLLIKENQISQVNEFSTFLRMGICKSLGSSKSFLWCTSYLEPVPGFLHPGSPQVHSQCSCSSKGPDGGSTLRLPLCQMMFFVHTRTTAFHLQGPTRHSLGTRMTSSAHMFL